jgi:signal transduction histidine kinase
MIAEDLLNSAAPAFVRVIPVSWLAPNWLDMVQEAHERLTAAAAVKPLRTPTIELVLSDRVAFLTRRFIPAVTLDKWHPLRPIDLRRFVGICLTAIDALAELHDLDLVHGNIKASNLCIRKDVATLVDHGLAGWNRTSNDVSAAFADAASDLTSLGSLLLDMYHRINPRREQEEHAAEQYHLRTTLATILARLAGRDGYQALSGVRADLVALEAHGVAGPVSLVIGASDVRRDLAAGAFVARPEEWRALAQTLDTALTHRAQSILVEGSAGIGKTRLLEEFAGWAEQERGVRVAYIKSDSAVAPRPHLLLGRLVHALRRLQENQPTAHETGDPQPDVLAPQLQGEVRVRDAARSFVQQMNAVRGTPVMVVIDDCQFTRHEDRVLVSVLAEEFRVVGRGAALVFVHRGEQPGTGEDAPIGADSVDRVVRLGPLPTESVNSIVRSMTGQLEPGIIEQISGWVSGNPLATQNAVRFLVETRAIVPGPAGWHGPQSLPLPPTVLHPRIRSLPLQARLVLQTAAVIGNRGPLNVLASAAGLSPDNCREIVEDMAALGLLNALEERSADYAFSHDTVRESFLAADAETGRTLQQVHGLVAHALSETGSNDDFDLAFHLANAGRLADAYDHAVRAGRAARQAYSLATARQYFEIALHHQHRWELLDELGEVLMLAGNYKEAADTLAGSLEQQRELRTGAPAQARTLDLLGKTYFKMGALRQAEQHYVQALQMLGQSVPTSTSGLLFAIAQEIGVQNGWVRDRIGAAEDEEHRRLTASILGDLMYTLFFHDSIKTLWAQAREMTLVQTTAHDAPERGHAFATQAVVYGCILGRRRRAVRAGEAAMAVRSRAGDVWGNAHARHLYGAALLCVNEPRRSLGLVTPALERFEVTADRWEAHTARWHRALALYRLGDAEGAAHEAREARKLAHSIGDRQNWIIARAVQALATGGESADEDLENEWEGLHDKDDRYDVEALASDLFTQALHALHAGDLEAAARVLDDAVRELRRSHVLNAYVAPLFSWRATVTRWLAEQATPGTREARILATRAASRATAARLVSLVHANERKQSAVELRSSGRALARWAVAAPRARFGSLASSRDRDVDADPGENGPPAELAAWNDSLPLEVRGSTLGPSMRLLRRLAHAQQAAVVEPGRDGGQLRVLHGEFAEDSLQWLSVPGRLRTDEVQILRRFRTTIPRMGQILVLPLPLTVPLLMIAEKNHPSGFTAQECETASFIRDIVTHALRMEDAAAADAAAAIMREEAWRTRLASDLHDEVGQRLSASLIEVRRLENFLRQGRSDSLDDVIATIGEQLVACNKSVRNLVYETSPPSVAQFGLTEAVRDLVERASESSTGMRFSANITRSDDSPLRPAIPPSTEIACFRIVQEAVTNVIKHAAASECTVILSIEDDAVSVIVEDDGTGLNVGSESRGFGLVSMRERAAAAGGVLHLSGRPGAGSTVSAVLPVSVPAHRSEQDSSGR